MPQQQGKHALACILPSAFGLQVLYAYCLLGYSHHLMAASMILGLLGAEANLHAYCLFISVVHDLGFS